MRSVIMFDMDGTLVETMPQIIEICVGLAKAREPSASEDDLRKRVTDALHLPAPQMVPDLSALVGWDPSDFHAKLSEIVPRLSPVPFPEVHGVLASLKAAGYRLLMSSNTPEHLAKRRLESAGIAPYFDYALGTNLPAGIGKEDHPRLAAEHLALTATEFSKVAAYVGDTPGDMVLAKKASVLSIGRVSNKNGDELIAAGADHTIHDLTEVEPLVRL